MLVSPRACCCVHHTQVRIKYDFCKHMLEVTKIENGMSGQHRFIIALY